MSRWVSRSGREVPRKTRAPTQVCSNYMVCSYCIARHDAHALESRRCFFGMKKKTRGPAACEPLNRARQFPV